MATRSPLLICPAFCALAGEARLREVLDLAAHSPDLAANVDELAFVRRGSFAAVFSEPVAKSANPVRSIGVVAWNVERGRETLRWAELPAIAQADLLLLCEVDDGMARSNNADIAAELAAHLHLHYAYTPNYFEFTRGTRSERKRTRGIENARGFHGSAILSRFPLLDVRRIPLPVKFDWFRHDEQRIGTRVALAATVAVPGSPVTAVSVHIEAFTSPSERASQMRTLLAALGVGTNPVVLGGDFNTLGITPNWREGLGLAAYRMTGRGIDTARREPLFDEAKRAGFSRWETDPRAVTWRMSRRLPRAFGAKLDWIFTRGLAIARETAVTLEPPRSALGHALSDHDGIAVRLSLPSPKVGGDR